MGQITENFAKLMIEAVDKGHNPPLTAWEKKQLALAWLDREAALATQPQAPQGARAFCSCCGEISPSTFRQCKEHGTDKPFEDLCCDKCNFVIATLDGHLHAAPETPEGAKP